MAKAITRIEKHVPTPEQEQAQAVKQILEATANSRDALVVFLDILKELHRAGLLDIVQGMLKTRHKWGVTAMQTLNQPGMHRFIKNGISSLYFLGKLNPDQLQKIFDGAARGLERSAESMKEDKQTGLGGLVKTLRDPDVNASLTTMMAFLQGMGEEWNKGKKKVH
ncbi:DUF1641 domain-containing protein [Paenactinomyces guangxiensis]|uniref:DUF1641 domain-containing protein n=1 Tax=Paenactinomyces guangxiensis TaxID=1490290 RepID=A0A7W2A934_9BACL|nr:DUF1641 domain-containing protein [Paenactinomyces guangxiensis]MBA4494777.1 DUF1641 domain-containing protein [Paenactinomyces guangxiensis]MBH8591861.1 DUF1641 domain-containing protein [Paenactinomyces guangxiensis]